MRTTAARLLKVIDEYLPLLTSITEDEFEKKSNPEKWSRKEIMGHLIDSAQNNIRRFIVAQYENNPSIVYNQDKWVAINNYQQRASPDIIQLWYLLNKQIVFILKNTPEDMWQRTCQSGASYSINWLAEDYVKHLKHHIYVVLNLEPVAYP